MVQIKRKVVVVAGILLAVIAAIVLLVWMPLYEEGKSIGVKFSGTDEILELEKSFQEAPSIPTGIMLLEKQLFLYNDPGKAIEYGAKCIELGANDTSGAWLVNLWLAKAYDLTNQRAKARFHLSRAIEFDTEGLIEKNNSIDSLEMGHLLEE